MKTPGKEWGTRERENQISWKFTLFPTRGRADRLHRRPENIATVGIEIVPGGTKGVEAFQERFIRRLFLPLGADEDG